MLEWQQCKPNFRLSKNMNMGEQQHFCILG